MHNERVVKIYPPDYTGQEYKPNWTLRHPIKVIYDDINTGTDCFARLCFPLTGIQSSLDSNPSIGGILVGTGNIQVSDYMAIGSRRLVNTMAAHYDYYIKMRSDKDCPPGIRAMRRRLKRILTETS